MDILEKKYKEFCELPDINKIYWHTKHWFIIFLRLHENKYDEKILKEFIKSKQ